MESSELNKTDSVMHHNLAYRRSLVDNNTPNNDIFCHLYLHMSYLHCPNVLTVFAAHFYRVIYECLHIDLLMEKVPANPNEVLDSVKKYTYIQVKSSRHVEMVFVHRGYDNLRISVFL